MGYCRVFNQQLIQCNIAKVHREKRCFRQREMRYNVIMLPRMVQIHFECVSKGIVAVICRCGIGEIAAIDHSSSSAKQHNIIL